MEVASAYTIIRKYMWNINIKEKSLKNLIRMNRTDISLEDNIELVLLIALNLIFILVNAHEQNNKVCVSFD